MHMKINVRNKCTKVSISEVFSAVLVMCVISLIQIADDDRTHNKLLAAIGALDDKKR